MSRLRRLRLLLSSLALGAALIVVLSAPAFAYPDVDASDPYAAAIETLAARGVLNGRVDGTFGPDDPLTRCQFAKLIVNTLGLDHVDTAMPFRDVGPGDLPSYVAAAARAGITRGTDEAGRRFSPWKGVSRAQAVTMTVRGLERLYPELLVDPLSYPSDWGIFDQGQHLEAAGRAQVSGLLAGLPLPELDPWALMTRGEVAQVLANVLRVMAQGVPGEPAEVTAVVDEATLEATLRGVEETIRLIGIGLPTRDLPYRRKAEQWLVETVEGKTVVLQSDRVARDEEGRLLAYVFASGRFVNAELLRQGLAQEQRRSPFDTYGMRLWQALSEGAFEGKANSRGLWTGWKPPPFTSGYWHYDGVGSDPTQEWWEFRSIEAVSLLGWYVENYRGDRYYFPDIVVPVGETFRIRSGAGTDGPNDLYWGSSTLMWTHVIDPRQIVWEVSIFDEQDRLVDGAGGGMFWD